MDFFYQIIHSCAVATPELYYLNIHTKMQWSIAERTKCFFHFARSNQIRLAVHVWNRTLFILKH